MIHAAFLLLAMAPAQEGAEALIRQFSEDSLETRAAAEEKLVAMGEAARPALLKAAETGDAEARTRIARVLKALDARRDLRKWMAPPSRITLSGEMTLEEAAREIEKQSGQKATCESWPDGKFRVDVKNVRYWDALEAVCEASKSRSLFLRDSGPVIGGTSYVKVPSSVAGAFCLRFESIREYRRFNSAGGGDQWTMTLLLHLAWERSMDPAKTFLALEEARDDVGTDYVPGFAEYMSRTFSGTPFHVQDPPPSVMKPLHVGSFARIAEKATRMTSIKGSVLVWIRASTDDLELAITPDPADVFETDLRVCGEDLKEKSKATFTLSKSGRKGDTLTFELNVDGIDARMLKDTFALWHVKDTKGQRYVAYPYRPNSGGLGPDKMSFGFTVRGLPADVAVDSLVIRLPKRVVALEIPFHLRDIPLK